MTYCEFVRSGKAHPVHVHYHDHVYGFPVETDDALFERLVLEINQAGLSWETILKKQDSFRTAYDSFAIAKVAAYGESDIARLLADPGIIRNRLKVRAAITNAQKILAWVALFKKTFTFTGGEIVGEFLMSCGYLPGAHDLDCPRCPCS